MENYKEYETMVEFANEICENNGNNGYIAIKYRGCFSFPLTDNEFIAVCMLAKESDYEFVITSDLEIAEEFGISGKLLD